MISLPLSDIVQDSDHKVVLWANTGLSFCFQAIVSLQKEAVIGFPNNPSRHLGFFYVNVQVIFLDRRTLQRPWWVARERHTDGLDSILFIHDVNQYHLSREQQHLQEHIYACWQQLFLWESQQTLSSAHVFICQIYTSQTIASVSSKDSIKLYRWKTWRKVTRVLPNKSSKTLAPESASQR